VRYITIDLFGKVAVGKSTIFALFADPQGRLLQEGGNLSYDPRTYYARCWILPNRWNHSMVFLADPKFDMRQNALDNKYLAKMFEMTNILMIVTDSSQSDVDAVCRSIPVYSRIKLGLVIFIIANMQDKPDTLSVEEIQKQTGIADVLGISAIDASVRPILEEFFESAVKRYFLLLAKRGQSLELV
jgi:hypothetical protein